MRPDSPPPRTILITGASSGFGAAIARELARGRHRLALTARREGRLEVLGAELEEAGSEVLILPGSLEDPEAPERLVAATVGRFGGLDVLINVAGHGIPALFGDSDPAELRRQFEVNLIAPILLARHALPHLVRSRGTIINVGSAITAIPNPIFGVYGTTKAGLAWWTDALRREYLWRGVKVCLVEPGPVRTEFFDALPTYGHRTSGKILKPPSSLLTGRLDDAARRIARLIDRPRRRISMLRRVVWPFRLIGVLFRLWPALGDLAIAPMPQYYRPVTDRSSGPGGCRPCSDVLTTCWG